MTKRAPVDFMAGFRAIEQSDGIQRHPPKAILHAVMEGTETPSTTGAVQQPSRRGKVAITHWVDPVVRKQLTQLALDSDRSQAELVSEGLNLLFEKYDRSPIATP